MRYQIVAPPPDNEHLGSVNENAMGTRIEIIAEGPADEALLKEMGADRKKRFLSEIAVSVSGDSKGTVLIVERDQKSKMAQIMAGRQLQSLNQVYQKENADDAELSFARLLDARRAGDREAALQAVEELEHNGFVVGMCPPNAEDVPVVKDAGAVEVVIDREKVEAGKVLARELPEGKGPVAYDSFPPLAKQQENRHAT